MSGLEAMAALGLACNIFQVISFGHETISLVKRIYQNGTPGGALSGNASHLREIASRIESAQVPSAAASARQDQILLTVAQKCQTAARDLQEEVKFIVEGAAAGSLGATLKVAVKTNWRKRRLDRLEKDLRDAERLMQTGLLAQTW